MPQKRTIPRACEQCSAAFLARAAHVKNGKARFCSKRCAMRHLRAPSIIHIEPGQRFGRLIALRDNTDPERPTGVRPSWVCQCDCGQATTVVAHHLISGNTTSCGCHGRNGLHRTHGLSKTAPEYLTWGRMIQRCTNQRHPKYPRYGGRGITVCERWRSFENFYADMGARPSPLHSIDRIDNDGNYEPGNCRWATPKQQVRNRSNTRMLTIDGVTLPQAEWSDRRASNGN